METTLKSFEDFLAFGQEGEHTVAKFLISRGVTLLPLYQFAATSAPKMLSNFINYTSPDLVCFKDGICFFVEVKTKTRWSQDSNMKIETGLDLRLYNDYLKLFEQTKIPFWVIFNHTEKNPCGLFAVNIRTKPSRLWDGLHHQTKIKVSKPLALWSIDNLKKI